MTPTFWDKRSKHYDDNVKKHDLVFQKTIERSRLLLTDSDVVLDFACASGEFSLDIAPAVQRVHGIDTSAKMIDLANQKVRDRQVGNVSFDQMDTFGERLASDSFSAVLAFNIFHLLQDATQVLARLNDLLTAGGLLISQTPCLSERSWLFQSFVGLAQKTGLAPTITNFTFSELESFVSSGNFEIIETKIWDEKQAVQWIVARKT